IAGGPGQDGELWPVPAPSRGLGLVDVASGEHRIRPDDEVEDVGQAVRRVDPPSLAVFQPDAEARGGRLVRVDRRLGGGMRRTGHAELLLVPQVDAGLVANLYRGG